ncbi:cytochrome c oxidase subunit II [Geminocystis sp. CENA526]|uniref:cytochrome c oxidase subunit II n=1 Tax=Geminocystis sp. CENA526 TaxID=1355871 RepID=UPI003D6E9614
MNIPGNIITLIAGILLTLISLWYGQNHGLMPVEASEGAAQVDGLFNLMMTIATGLFLIVEGVLVYCLIKFRRKKGDKTDGPGIEGNVPLEIVWTAIPTVIVFILALYSFEVYNNLGGLDPETSRDFPQEEMQMAENQGKMVAYNPHQGHLSLGIGNSKADLEVEVNGIQYAWIFTYPDSGVISGELHVPVNKQVKLTMKAGDVIHAFWVPQLRLKQDVLPGRDSALAFSANRIGDYPIVCAELCGAYHGGMKTTLHVESEEDYQKWIQENTFASAEEKADTMAMMTQPMSEEKRLEMHSHHLGVTPETLAQLHN